MLDNFILGVAFTLVAAVAFVIGFCWAVATGRS